MFNPIDMLQAQNGAGLQGMGQQFGLTPEQTRRAFEALMPAFALGLQKTGEMGGFAPFFGMAGTPWGSPPKAAEAPFAQLFGSPMLTQAVLQQASAASGVGSQVLRQMLPVMAGMVVASLVHMLLNQPAPSEPARAPAPDPFPMNAVWADMMRAFLPAQQPVPAQQPAPAAKARTAAPKAAAAPGAAAERTETPAYDMFHQMLQTGAEVQERNVKAMQGIFDAFWTEAERDKGSAAGSAAPAGPDGAAPEGPKPPEPAAPWTEGKPGSRGKPERG
jgi:hypothetical protein